MRIPACLSRRLMASQGCDEINLLQSEEPWVYKGAHPRGQNGNPSQNQELRGECQQLKFEEQKSKVMTEKLNIVLIHGGFVDGSGWDGVYKFLRKKGYNVSIVQ